MKTPLRKLSGQGQARNNFLALGVSRALGHSAMHIGRCCSSACRQGAALPQRGPGVSQRSLGQHCWGVASAARARGIAQTAGAGHLLQRNILPLARVPGIRMRAAANSMQDIRHRYCHYDDQQERHTKRHHPMPFRRHRIAKPKLVAIEFHFFLPRVL